MFTELSLKRPLVSVQVNVDTASQYVHEHGQDRALLKRNYQIAVDRVLRSLLLCVLPIVYDLMNLL